MKIKIHKPFHISVAKMLIVELLVFLLLFGLGFKITYAPELENDWEAISAVGEWVGAIIIPFVILWLERKWDSNKKEIALSNLVTSDQLRELELKLTPLIKKASGEEKIDLSTDKSNVSVHEQQILQYLAISMGANTHEIALHIGLPVPTTQRLLHKMLQEGKIIECGNPRRRIYKTVFTHGSFQQEE